MDFRLKFSIEPMQGVCSTIDNFQLRLLLCDICVLSDLNKIQFDE